MDQFNVFIKKELIQILRELKFIWLPIVFILLGLTQPLVSYFLPAIIEELGGVNGIIIDSSFTVQKGGEVLASTLGSQFDQLGIIIIVISLMSTVQADKENGMLAFFLTRPVKPINYLGSKIISHYLLVAGSVMIGYLTSFFYVNLLFTAVDIKALTISLIFYLLWVLFIVLFTIMISTIFNSQGVIALISIISLIGIRLITGINPVIDFVNPAIMSKFAMEILIIGELDSHILFHVIVICLVMLFPVLVSEYWITTKRYHRE